MSRNLVSGSILVEHPQLPTSSHLPTRLRPCLRNLGSPAAIWMSLGVDRRHIGIQWLVKFHLFICYLFLLPLAAAKRPRHASRRWCTDRHASKLRVSLVVPIAWKKVNLPRLDDPHNLIPSQRNLI